MESSHIHSALLTHKWSLISSIVCIVSEAQSTLRRMHLHLLNIWLSRWWENRASIIFFNVCWVRSMFTRAYLHFQHMWLYTINLCLGPDFCYSNAKKKIWSVASLKWDLLLFNLFFPTLTEDENFSLRDWSLICLLQVLPFSFICCGGQECNMGIEIKTKYYSIVLWGFWLKWRAHGLC